MRPVFRYHRWPAKEVSLPCVHAQIRHGLQLRVGFDSFCNENGTDLLSEPDHRRSQGALSLV
jgi:hypothetical protein